MRDYETLGGSIIWAVILTVVFAIFPNPVTAGIALLCYGIVILCALPHIGNILLVIGIVLYYIFSKLLFAIVFIFLLVKEAFSARTNRKNLALKSKIEQDERLQRINRKLDQLNKKRG